MRILVIDDHPLFRAGLKALLAGLDASIEVTEAAGIDDAVAGLKMPGPADLVLLDMNLRQTVGLETLSKARSAFESSSIVVISGDEDPGLIRAVIEAGAAGFIPKSTDAAVTVQALRLVLAHGVYLPPQALHQSRDESGAVPVAGGKQPSALSERQLEILQRLLQGKSNKIIAREMKIADGTVKAHLSAIYQALGVSTRTQAMYRAHENGLVAAMRGVGRR